MMRSMFSGVSGLKNMQLAMDVIGNNMANVNTPGFKRSRVVFKDTLYQAMKGGAAPTDSSGGTNPMGIGMGIAVASVDQIHTGASAQSTSSLTDMAIDGTGYFVIKDTGETKYTRAGSFSFDKQGNLVTSGGGLVQGWLADAQGAIDSSVSKVTNINISSYNLMAPKATTTMGITGNLDAATAANDIADGFILASDTPAEGTSETITKEYYDSLGNKGVLYFRFFRTVNDASATPASYSWNCDVSSDPEFGDANNDGTVDIETVDPQGATPAAGADVYRYTGIHFDAAGKLITDTTTAGVNATSMSLAIDRSSAGADDLQIEVDLSQLMQYNTDSTVQVETQDGLPTGSLQSLSVSSDGVISGQYDNGQLRNLCRVALAKFRNAAGLEQVGSNEFITSTNSGDAMIGAPTAGGMGSILPSSLESSNVDLSEELTNMIIVERGFTANSRIITTSDEMLQELSNLKR